MICLIGLVVAWMLLNWLYVLLSTELRRAVMESYKFTKSLWFWTCLTATYTFATIIFVIRERIVCYKLLRDLKEDK